MTDQPPSQVTTAEAEEPVASTKPTRRTRPGRPTTAPVTGSPDTSTPPDAVVSAEAGEQTRATSPTQESRPRKKSAPATTTGRKTSARPTTPAASDATRSATADGAAADPSVPTADPDTSVGSAAPGPVARKSATKATAAKKSPAKKTTATKKAVPAKKATPPARKGGSSAASPTADPAAAAAPAVAVSDTHTAPALATVPAAPPEPDLPTGPDLPTEPNLPTVAAEPVPAPAIPAPTVPAAPDTSTPRTTVRIFDHPGYAPELLALTAVRVLGPEADAWLRRTRADYPNATPDGLARLATRRFIRLAAAGSAASAAAGFFAPFAALTTLAWTQSRLVLHLAAAFGEDPTAADRATELLVLSRIHPDDASARDALRAAAQAPSQAEPAPQRVAEAGWRLATPLAVRAPAWLALRYAARRMPGVLLLAAATSGAADTERLAARAIARYRSAPR